MRRKQTSIHFSRSALPHRYIRYISWISWNGGYRPQPSTSWVFFRPVPQLRTVLRRCPYPEAAIATLLPLLPARREQPLSDLSPRKRKITFFPFPAHLSRAAPLMSLCPQLFVRITPRSICGRSAARPHVVFCGPPQTKKMRAHGIAPRTRSSKKEQTSRSRKHT